MKKLFTLLSVAALSTAFGQLSAVEVPMQGIPTSTEVQQSPRTSDEFILSQHIDDTLPTTAGAIRCSGSTNGWGRLFDLSNFGITSDFTITGTSIGTMLFPEGYVDSKVFLATGVEEGADRIPYENLEETEYYGSFSNVTNARTWQWENVEGLQTVTVPSNSKIYVTFEGPWTTDANYLGTFWPLYNQSGQTHSAYFGSPTVNCTATSEGQEPAAVSFSSIGMVGTTNVTDWVYLMKVTGETEELGTIELGSNKLSVYPNPATSDVVIKLDGSSINKVEIADVTGRVVALPKSTKDGKINVSNLSKGVYFLRVQDDKGVTRIEKLIKK